MRVSEISDPRRWSLWTWLALAGFCALVCFRLARLIPGMPEPVLFVLGILPNFFGAPAFTFAGVAAKYPLSSSPEMRHESALRLLQDRWFLVCLFGSLLFLLAAELFQIRGPMLFDPYDLLASTLGTVATGWLYVFVRLAGEIHDEA